MVLPMGWDTVHFMLISSASFFPPKCSREPLGEDTAPIDTVVLLPARVQGLLQDQSELPIFGLFFLRQSNRLKS